MRKFLLIVTVCVTVLLSQTATTIQADSFPDQIDLPSGYFPEGIAVGLGSTFYVGSLADGSIYKGDLRTGAGEVLTAASGQFTTIGIEVDNKGRIWVAGGPTGTGRVYDADTGALLATYEFTAPFESFVNDVVVTNKAAYFTDSGTTTPQPPQGFWFAGEPRIFVVPLEAGQALPDQSAVSTLATDVPDIAFPNLNGIETTPDGSRLVVAHTVGAALFTVDPSSGNSALIDTGMPFPGADGIVRRGNTIYVVENSIAQISAVTIAPDGSTGAVTATYTVAGVETPTTADLFGNALYTVDAKFTSMSDPYKVYRVELN
jgi:hypothetical protein